MRVEREDVGVVYVAAGPDGAPGAFDRLIEALAGPGEAPEGFDKLDASLPLFGGREFYGVYPAPDGGYRACATLREGDDPDGLGLATWVVPGGEYEYREIPNDPDRIGGTFAAMEAEHPRDEGRPGIEFYPDRRRIVLFLPVREPA